MVTKWHNLCGLLVLGQHWWAGHHRLPVDMMLEVEQAGDGHQIIVKDFVQLMSIMDPLDLFDRFESARPVTLSWYTVVWKCVQIAYIVTTLNLHGVEDLVTALLFIVHTASNDYRSEIWPNAVPIKLHPVIEAVLLHTLQNIHYHMCTQLWLLLASAK